VSDTLSIKVLGSGCAKCQNLETAAKQAVQRLGINAEVEHVTDFAQIIEFGVMTTPALVVNDEVKVAGRAVSADEVARILETAL